MKSDSNVEKSAYHSLYSLYLKLCEQSALVVIKIMVEFDREAAKKIILHPRNIKKCVYGNESGSAITRKLEHQL